MRTIVASCCLLMSFGVLHSNENVLQPMLGIEQAAPILNIPDSLRFVALDTVSAGLYADLSKTLDTQITEAPRAALKGGDDHPPVIIFSDTCLVEDGQTSNSKPCKAASSITLEQLKKAIAARTKGAKGTFLCEFKASNKYVHCVLQPDFTDVVHETTILKDAEAEALRIQSKRQSESSTSSEHGSTLADNIRKEADGLHRGPCRLAIDGSGKHVIPTLKLGVGAASSMTVYTSCPNTKDNVFSGGALVAEADLEMLKQAAARLSKKYNRATCHCRVVAQFANDTAASDNDFTVTTPADKAAAASSNGPALRCQCVELATTPASVAGADSGARDEVEGRVAIVRKSLFDYWQRLQDASVNATSWKQAVDAGLQKLRSHNLAGPTVAGGLKGVAAAGPKIDAIAVHAYETFDPYLISRSQSVDPNRFAAAKSHSMWNDEAEDALPEAIQSEDDALYFRLGQSTMKKITPAFTCTAAGELAQITTLMERLVHVTDEIQSVMPADDNHEKIRAAPIPVVVQEHVKRLVTLQSRIKRDISLVAARVDSVPNTSPALVARAMKALAASSAEGVMLLRRLLKRDVGSTVDSVAIAASRGIATMYVTNQSASMCAMWPRCLSLLGGTALQNWIVKRVVKEANASIPTGETCADGGVSTNTAAPIAQISDVDVKALPSTVDAADDKELMAAVDAGMKERKEKNARQKDRDSADLAALRGRIQLLTLRAWCDSSKPLALLHDVARMLYKHVKKPEQPSPSPTPTPSAEASPSSEPLKLHVTSLQGEKAMMAAAAVRTSRTIVKPLTLSDNAFVEVNQGPAVPDDAHKLSLAALIEVIHTSEDATSLLLRLNGTLSCMCLFAGVPIKNISTHGVPAVEAPSNWKAILRDFTHEISNMQRRLLAQPANSSSSEEMLQPDSSSVFFAHIARDSVELPPATDEEAVAYLGTRIDELKASLAEKRDNFVLMLNNRRDLNGADFESQLTKLKAEKAQVEAEKARISDLLRSRLATIKADLQQRLRALNKTVSGMNERLHQTRKLSVAATAAAREGRDADLQYLQQLQALLSQLQGLAANAKAAGEHSFAPAKWIAGCQGGGGETGSILARRHASALNTLANLQMQVQRVAEDAMAATASDAAKKANLARLEQLQEVVDKQHATVLALSLQFEMATCSCVQKVAGIKCARGIVNNNNDNTGAPLELAAKGNFTGAAEAAANAMQQLQDARAALEGERRRWEEAVVRLIRPKTCLQLQSLATGGVDGVYTIFPPDDLQYRGIKVYCDMTTAGGGWTLVGVAPNAVLGSPLSVRAAGANSNMEALSRTQPGTVNAIWIAQASTEMAVAWTRSETAPEGGIAGFENAIAMGLPDPGITNMAIMPPPPTQPCDSISGDYAKVPVRCLSTPINETCPFPSHMYTATSSLGVCMGHAYGAVLRSDTSVCDGFLTTQFQNSTRQLTTAGDVLVQAGVFVSVDGAPGCSGVVTPQSTAEVIIPRHMSIWMR